MRRSASDPGKAATKEARLESGAEVIASGAPEVTQAVVDRIGLTFDQFTRCVVLPQGAFARFLHDKPKTRQDLLNQLLGLGLYQRLAVQANARAATAKAEANVFGPQIAALAQYTADLERQTAARLAAVTELVADFGRARPALDALQREAIELDRAAAEDDADRTRLAELVMPSEVVGLAERRAALDAAQRSARAGWERARSRLESAERRRSDLGELAPLVRLQGLFGQLADKRGRVLGERLQLDQATEAVQRQEAALAAKTGQRSRLGDIEPLVARQALLRQLRTKRQASTGTAAELARAAARAQDAQRASQAAELAEVEARAELDRIRAKHYAQALRTGLRPGEPCPVCEQEVKALPRVERPGGIQDAERRLTSTRGQRTAAAAAHVAAAAAAAAAEQLHASVVREIDDLGKQAERQLPHRGTGQTPSEAELDEQIAAIGRLDEELKQASRAHADATVDRAGVETRCAALTRDIATLEEQTRDAPETAVIDARVEAIQKIEAELTRLRAEQGQATERLDECDRAARGLAREEEGLWSRLDALRVSVIRQAPPQPDRGTGLGASWDAMIDWARTKVAELQGRIDTARKDAATRRASWSERLTGFLTALAALDGEVDSRRGAAQADEVAMLLAASEVRVSTALDTIRAKREERSTLEAQLEGARRREAVAGRLATLLGARSFQRWRLAGAFEQLVGGASRRLRELSGTAYSLTHTSQLGFEVIDHANADERRSVRTLSGGETFLASLSLAVALADQVADLAATGAARLESMFLDEGFGSLDPETLDTVASALEELGSNGRTLGIVTHVPALAERVPVQFRVTKDAATARVERVAP